MFFICSRMALADYTILIGDIPFLALSPHDVRMLRRGGVVVWARRSTEGWRTLSIQESPMISALGTWRPPDADVVLVSPPIADGRRRREVRRVVESCAGLTVVRRP